MVGTLAATACTLPGKNIGDLGDTGSGSGSGSASPGSGSGSGSGSIDPTGGEEETTASTTSAGGLGGVCEGELSGSFIAWQAARDGAANAYSFVMHDTLVYADLCRGEVYVACNTATTLTVADGVVVSRSFEATPASADTLAEDCPEPYDESGDALGSHADGYPIATVDDVYLSCCDMAQMQGGYHTDYDEGYSPGDVVVTLGDDSLLQGCTAQYCDDCGCTGDVGISIESITLGQ